MQNANSAYPKYNMTMSTIMTSKSAEKLYFKENITVKKKVKLYTLP